VKNLLLTGAPRVGKTTLVMKVLDRGIPLAGGFHTEEIRERGRRVGFKVKAVGGAEAVMAHVNSRSRYRVGKYGVEVAAFEDVGVRSIETALERDGIILMDEIGRMELYSEKFKDAVKRALDSPNRVFGVIQRKHNPFLDSIRRRDDTEVVTVTTSNRDTILPELLRKLGAAP